jgi:hypothetical protein
MRSGRLHRKDLTEGCLSAAGRGPKDRVRGLGVWERSVEIGQEDESLGTNAMLFEPLEERPKLCASAPDWVERNTLPCFEGLNRMHDRVEVEHVDALGSLAFEDRAHLGLEEPQLPGVHGTRTVHSDRDFTDALESRYVHRGR